MTHPLAERFPLRNGNCRVYCHPDCLWHEGPADHPERPERLEAILEGCLELPKRLPVSFVIPEAATFDQLRAVHDKNYLQRLEEAAHHQSTFMSDDNYLCQDSFDAIRAAAGCAIATGETLLGNGRAFALTRPPGHHAGRSSAEGFCFVNHIALAVETVRSERPGARFLIVDFDVHHGNGIDRIYERDDTVFYYSIHGDPAHIYPNSGFPDDQGSAQGHGFTRNVTIGEGTSGDEWLRIFADSLSEVERTFAPDYLIVGAGFDAHREDPFSLLELEDTHYLAAAQLLIQLANDHCEGRSAWLLEGGYSTSVLKRLVPACVSLLADSSNPGARGSRD